MSRIRYVGGNIIKTTKGDYNMHSLEDIIFSSNQKVIETAEQGIFYGDPDPFPEKEEEDRKGGIHTRFYDEQGQQIYEIPKKLHKAFNEEYGIKIAYDKENEMLYYEGECTPAYEKTSLTAIGHWKKELDRGQISKGKLLFGYNFGYEIIAEPSNNNWSGSIPYSLEDFDNEGNVLYLKKEKGSIEVGKVPGIPKADIQDWSEKERKRNRNNRIDTKIVIGDIAFIDLGDFDDNLNQIGCEYIFTYERKYKQCKMELPKINRYFNFIRILEHEFLGHAIRKLTDIPYPWGAKEEQTEGPVPVEAKLCNVIRREIGIPDRTNYTAKDEGGISISFGYLNGSDESDGSITIYDPEWGGYRSIYLPPKLPRDHGRFEIQRKNIEKLSSVKYYKTIKYHVHKKIFNFD